MGKYDDIIHLPHHTSSKRVRMPMLDRAAQFSPFAALTGYEDAIEETGRLTERKLELGEYDRAILDQKQRILTDAADSHPRISLTYFVPDPRKEGGAYEYAWGSLKKIDAYERLLVLTDGRKFPLDDIIDIDSDLFSML